MSAITTASAISLGLGALGTGASVVGQMNAQAVAGAQANYMAQVARHNQALAEQQAQDAIKRGQIAEQRQRDLTGQRIGTQTAALAAQGTDLEGSPTDILADTARAGELDALTIRNNSERQAAAYRAVGLNYGADAALRESFQPSYLGAGTSLLMGASSLAAKWDKFRSADTSDPMAAAGTPGSSYYGPIYSGASGT